MEKESKSSTTHDGSTRNIAAVTNNGHVSKITEVANNGDSNEEETGVSGFFGATGRRKRRILGAVCSCNRRIGKAIKIKQPSNYNTRARAEIDTRADTVCAGSTLILYESTGKVADVSGFHDSLISKLSLQLT
jgi:hypothetical protein